MSIKRLLTLEDLYKYYASSTESIHFCATDADMPVVVQVPGNLSFNEDNNFTEGLLPVTLQSCHIGKNINGSKISEEVMNSALPSFSNRPILGYIHTVDGEPHFYKHNMHEDDEGNIVYDEIPVGIVPESCNARLEYDVEKDKTYVIIEGYIFEEYSKAAEILKREKECSVSVELSIREFSYNAKECCLVIESFYFSGVTILGKDPSGEEIKPGMVGSNIKLVDFSEKNNSLFANKYEQYLVEMQEKLDNLISCFNINSFKKGGDTMNHFEELLAKYGKTLDDISFEYENMSDEELDAKFVELFDDTEIDKGVDNSDVVMKENNDEIEVETEVETEVEIEDEDNLESNVFVRSFELSHDDIRYALYNLLIPYEESDNTFYYITNVYDKYFIYESFENSITFGQSYKTDGDNVSFDGERYELFKEFLTASEKAELETMRSNYSEMSDKLKAYENSELEAKKKELLNSEDYISIQNNAEFAKLVENHSDVSFEELQSLCDNILLSVVKSGNFSMVKPEQNIKPISKKQFANPTNKKTKRSRYGNLFKEKE